MGVHLVFMFQLILPLWLILVAESQEPNMLSCTEPCGNVTIMSPFGMTPGCYQNSWFRVTCNETVHGRKPFLSRIHLEFLGSFSNAVAVKSPVAYINCPNRVNEGDGFKLKADSPFFFSSAANSFGSIGCGNLVTLRRNKTPIAGCIQPRCGDLRTDSLCYSSFSENLTSFTATVQESYHGMGGNSKRCSSAFIFNPNYDTISGKFRKGNDIDITYLSAMLEWTAPVNCDLEGAQCGLAPYKPRRNCTERCGGVDIEYPFGIQPGCYMSDWFKVSCKESDAGPMPSISKFDLQLVSFSFSHGTVQVNHSVVYSNCHDINDNNGVSVDLTDSPFYFSDEYNRVVAVGCGGLATISRNQIDVIGGCVQPSCGSNILSARFGRCFIDHIPPGIGSFVANITEIEKGNNKSCGFAFMAADSEVESFWDYYGMFVDPQLISRRTHFATWLQWGTVKAGLCYLNEEGLDINCSSDGFCWKNLSSSYLCVCYSDLMHSVNSVSIDVCQGFSSGLVTLFLLLSALYTYKMLERRRKIKLKRKYFKRNGGLLLRKQLSHNEGSSMAENIRFFSAKELEKATDYYNENRILGQGGQGTVYKGMLADGRIVAVKKSILEKNKKKQFLDEKQVEQWVNDVVILSQINHRNVVKLLGCCLETQFPLLVYEFIPNGTLSQMIHEHNEEFPFTWDMRLRIGTEVANALSYLHSAASVPIYHRDIKSSNILLDDKYRAKVSDFRTSRSIPLEQTHLTTRVQGTFGYLDPEYFRSNQFTDKSDVYSFGVVLLELLTGKKPISSLQIEEDEEVKSLATSFLLAMKENSLFDILDPHVINDGSEEEITAVAKLAKRCLNLNGKRRPTMKQVAMELENIRTAPEDNYIQQISDVDEDFEDDGIKPWTIGSCSTTSNMKDSATFPLLVSNAI